MVSACGQCGGTDFDTGDTSLQRICTSCGVVSTDQSSTPLNEDVGTYELRSPEHHCIQNLPAHYSVNDTNDCDSEVTHSLSQALNNTQAETCKNCGGTEFDVGDLSNSCQKVCVKCGVVVDDQSANITSDDGLTSQGFVSSKSDFHCRGNLPAHYSYHSDTNRIPRGANVALKKYALLAQKLNLPDHVQQHGENIFRQELERVKAKHMACKIKVAAACLYYACRHYGRPVTISEVAGLVEGCTKYDIMENFRKLCENLDVEMKHLTYKERIEIETMKFKEPLDKELLENIHRLSELLESVSLPDGRNPRAVIAATIYTVLLASGQPKLDLKKFVKEHGYDNELNTCRLRYNEILKVLCTVAKKIPWLAMQNIKNKNVLHHLKDILAYRKSLKFEISKGGNNLDLPDKPAVLSSKVENGKCDGTSCLTGTSTKAVNAGISNETGFEGTQETRRKRKNGEWIGKYPPSFDPSDNKNASALVPKKLKVEMEKTDRDLDNTELDENDMCDSELNSYLRSGNEVKLYRRLVEK